jgi:hypothetical protein
LQHYYLAGQVGINADNVGDDYRLETEPDWQAGRFTDSGSLSVELPPSSVSTFIIRKKVKGE